jgi:hypothetical protein
MIIEANGKYYTTTQHTDEKMLERDITENQIKQVIEQGTHDLTNKGDNIYLFKVTGRVIAVIIADEERIVSVFIAE